jgi:hypothetical protein
LEIKLCQNPVQHPLPLQDTTLKKLSIP